MTKEDDCGSKFASANVDDYEEANNGIISNLPKISIPISEGNEDDASVRDNDYSDDESDSDTPKMKNSRLQ